MGVLADQYKTLMDRSYKTYQARLRASQRLAARNRAWNTFLISMATSTTIASIGLLTDPNMYGSRGATLMVCVAVLSLVASLVTSGLDYSGRSRNMFLNYRKVQRLSSSAERASLNEDLQSEAHLEELSAQYDALLDESENQAEADYWRAFPQGKKGWAVRREQALTVAPYASCALPIALLVPLIKWLIG